MANEFKIKKGLQILDSHPVYGISDSSSFNYDVSLLATINAIQGYIDATHIDEAFLRESSLGDKFIWDASSMLDISTLNIEDYFYTKDEVDALIDGSLATRDASITYLYDWNTDQDVSIDTLFARPISDVTKAYVDGSLAERDTSITYLYDWNTDQDVSITTLFEREVSIIYDTNLDSSLKVPESVGGIEAGTTVYELYGSTLINMWDNLLFPTVLAYIESNNSLSLGGLSNATAEVGTEYTPTLTATYNPGLINNGDNTAGPNLTGDASNWIFKFPNGGTDDTITATSNSQGNTYAAYNIAFGTNRWSVTCEYLEGTGDYYDNKGNIVTNLDAQRIEDSRNANSGTITGRRLAWWDYGVKDSAPTDSIGVRTLSNNYFLNASNAGSFTITIPAETQEVYFYTVAGKTVVVQFVESAYADVTGSFDQDSITVNDAAGVGQNYTSYVSYIGVGGYPSVANYLVTIS